MVVLLKVSPAAASSPPVIDAWKQDPTWTSNQTRIQADLERRKALEPRYEAARQAYFAKLASGTDPGESKTTMDNWRKQLEELRWEISRLRTQQWRIEGRYRTQAFEAARALRTGAGTSAPSGGGTNLPSADPPSR